MDYTTETRAEPGVGVRFFFNESDPVALCQCGWSTVGDSPKDAFVSWWAHLAEKHEREMSW